MKYGIKLIIILIIVAIFIGYKLLDNNQSETKYITSKVENGEIIHSIKATGSLKPKKESRIYSDISGSVKKIFVNINDQIKIGQPLAIVEPSGFEARLKQSRARVKKSKDDLKLFEDSHNVNKVLYEKRLISKEELDDSLSKYSAALVLYEESKADLEQAKINLNKTKISSNVDGIVLERNVILGQQIHSNTSIPIFILAEDLKELHLISNVSEADIGNVQHEQEVIFNVEAFPDKKFKGSVIQISNSPNIENNLVTYNVVSLVNNDALNLKSGMTAEVEIIISSKKNVKKIPTAALRFTPAEFISDVLETDTTKIWVIDNNKLKSINIKTGISDDFHTEILEGDVKIGDDIIIESYLSEKEKNKTAFTLPQPKRF